MFSGDPEDRTLRKSEKNLLIPQIRRKIVREEYCPNEIKSDIIILKNFAQILDSCSQLLFFIAYEECVIQTGLLRAPLGCKELKIKMAHCLEFWNENDDVQRRAREEYLQERSEFRRTGVCRDDRKFMDEYLKSKKQNQASNS